MTISGPDRPKIPIYVGLDAEGEITNHIIMSKTKNEEKQAGESTQSRRRRKIRLDTPSHSLKKIIT